MNPTRRLFTTSVALLGFSAFVGSASASDKGQGKGKGKANHKNGKQLLGEKLKKNGKHVLEKKRRQHGFGGREGRQDHGRQGQARQKGRCGGHQVQDQQKNGLRRGSAVGLHATGPGAEFGHGLHRLRIHRRRWLRGDLLVPVRHDL